MKHRLTSVAVRAGTAARRRDPAGEGIAARVIDCHCVKPIDTETLAAAAEATGGRIVVAEDHHPEAGCRSGVLARVEDDLGPAFGALVGLVVGADRLIKGQLVGDDLRWPCLAADD